MKTIELHNKTASAEVFYSYTSRQKAELISEGGHNLSFVYGHDNHTPTYTQEDWNRIMKFALKGYLKRLND